MACVQFMCARIGMVTGTGLGGAVRQKGPRWLLFGGALGLLVANTINVGADLSGMADAAKMLTGVNSHICVILFGIGIAVATVQFRYHQIAMILKWLAVVLFAYVITAFMAGPDWGRVLRDTFIPSRPKGHAAWQNLVAILGTTISPYLFFWQAPQEVEEEKAMGRRLLVQREGATTKEMINRRLVLFQPCDVFHYSDNRVGPAPARDHKYRHVKTSSRSTASAYGNSGVCPLHRRDHWRRLSCNPNARWLGSIRFCRNLYVEARLGQIASRCASLLCSVDLFDIARAHLGFP